MKSGSPSRTTAAHKTQTKIPGLVLSRLPLLSLLLLFLPKLLRGTRDRWVAQVSFIIIYSTGLASFPRLSAPPHSSHTPITPRRPGGTRASSSGTQRNLRMKYKSGRVSTKAIFFFIVLKGSVFFMLSTRAFFLGTENLRMLALITVTF